MYAERHPGDDLAGRVVCVWQQVSEGDTTQLVVPDACVDLVWGPGGLFVAGPDTGPVPTPMAAGDTFVGVRFRPGAVGAVFGVPVHELLDRRVPLPDLPALTVLTDPTLAQPFASDPAFAPESALAPGPALASVGTGLASDAFAPGGAAFEPAGAASRREGAPTASWRARTDTDPAGMAARLAAMRAAVVARLREAPDPDPAAPAIARALRMGRSVRDVAWTLGLSERQLHRRSVASFGYSPKTLQRIVRFQRALTLARAGVPPAEVAVRAGYADQAHLSHDVKRLSGVPLGRLVSPVRHLP
ncbi:DUF6597 domain-containing transcriptional factor [Nonomuraea sp. NPDC049607]|uniref:DUF6597 domain-containing transcriptional factor n=1 Tax=Nonomuraea sp. NPDC049607 TaxID=3154732 RepID=UPI00341260B3